MPDNFLLIVGVMGLILGATRLGGYLLIQQVPTSPLVETWLGYLPGATLVALVAPMVVESGAVGVLAGAVVLAIMLRTDNVILAMIAGVAIVALFG